MQPFRSFHTGVKAACLLLCPFFACEAPSPAEAVNTATGVRRGRIAMVDSVRHYSVYVPPIKSRQSGGRLAAVPPKMPVVILLHGALSRPWCVDFDSEMRTYAKRRDFIVVYPCGTSVGKSGLLFWNAGVCCGPASKHKVDDVEFIRRLIAEVKTNYNVDENRLFVAGASNGAMLAYRVGVELSDQIAAIGSVDGCMWPTEKKPNSPVSVIEFHGTADKVIPYRGGTGKWFFFKVKNVPSTTQTLAYWVAANHCQAAPIRRDDVGVERVLYPGGDGGSAVQLVITKGGRHMWPGGRGSFFTDRKSHKVKCTEEMLDFFWKHPKDAKISTI
jgi:polyhydroxybutyrate depolymerase